MDESMSNKKYLLALGLAISTLALVSINAFGNIALILKAGPTPVLSIAAIVLAATAFVVTWKQRSRLVPGILAVSGLIFMVPALAAMGYSFESIIFPGPILGVIFGLVIIGLGVWRAIRITRTVTAAQ
jgi:hypothetical protein